MTKFDIKHRYYWCDRASDWGYSVESRWLYDMGRRELTTKTKPLSLREQYVLAQREECKPNLTKAAKQIASADWSAQLREKIKKSEAKTQHQVVLDIDYDLL